jgi:CO/xanthine dehydrogenase FAD-binding subunit
MITKYYRPQTLEEALDLLSGPHAYPLGGGTSLSHMKSETFSTVDLQALGLEKIRKVNDALRIGATVTLQVLLDYKQIPTAHQTIINLEAPLNLRNMATVAGTLVTCDGRSPFGVGMLTMDAKLEIQSSNKENTNVPLGEFFVKRKEFLQGRLITAIEIPLQVKFAYETVARSPGDRSIICAGLAQWPNGRIRLVLGGWGAVPILAMDGNDTNDLHEAAHNAANDSSDQWASSSYRMDMVSILTERCLAKLGS